MLLSVLYRYLENSTTPARPRDENKGKVKGLQFLFFGISVVVVHKPACQGELHGENGSTLSLFVSLCVCCGSLMLMLMQAHARLVLQVEFVYAKQVAEIFAKHWEPGVSQQCQPVQPHALFCRLSLPIPYMKAHAYSTNLCVFEHTLSQVPSSCR